MLSTPGLEELIHWAANWREMEELQGKEVLALIWKMSRMKPRETSEGSFLEKTHYEAEILLWSL